MSGSRFVPRMNELVAFEAAARHSNFTSAAVELRLTQGAVSRAIAELEGRLGISLFERVRQRVTLTEVGRNYFANVRGLLEQLRAATRQAHGRRARRRNSQSGGIADFRYAMARAPSTGFRGEVPTGHCEPEHAHSPLFV